MKTRVVRYFNDKVGWLHRVEGFVGGRVLIHEGYIEYPPTWRHAAGQLSESCARTAAQALSTLDKIPEYFEPVDVVAEFGE